jgi:hypothetical protein
MDFNLDCFTTYETDFQAFAEELEAWEQPAKPVLSNMAVFLCLYGENGLTPEEEFETLAHIKAVYAQTPEKVMKLQVEVTNHYWEETILFILP